jgi:acetyl-CoA carboxylase biotin carboxylase subunit
VRQQDVRIAGHAIEARVNAESPANGFMPTPGALTVWAAPEGADVRVDTACFPGWRITPYYDSLLAKVIARGADRRTAVDRLRSALAHLRVEGVATNAAFARDVLGDPDVLAGTVHTRWLEEVFMPNWRSTEVAA